MNDASVCVVSMPEHLPQYIEFIPQSISVNDASVCVVSMPEYLPQYIEFIPQSISVMLQYVWSACLNIFHSI